MAPRDRLVETVQDPAVLDRQRFRVALGRLVAFEIHQGKSGGVPELVGEVPALLEPFRGVDGSAVGELELLDRDAQVLGLGRTGRQRVAEGVGAVDLDDVDRVDAVAGRLRHPPPQSVLDHRVDVNVAERYVAAVEEAEDDHAGDPERDDVAGRREDARGVVFRKLGGCLGPAQSRVGPQGRAEPGIEDVGVLNQSVARSQLAAGQVGLGADQPAGPLGATPADVGTAFEGTLQIVLGASFAVPDRDPVPPPELAADAPVAFFAQPVEVALGVALGMDLDPARGDGVHRLLGEAGRAVRSSPMRTNHWSER